jgi:hypothetical protein
LQIKRAANWAEVLQLIQPLMPPPARTTIV